MRIVALKQEFSICKLPEDSDVRSDGEIYFIAKTDEELSLVCPTEKAPANAAARDDGWRAIRIEGVLDFSLVGILAGLSRVLAEANIVSDAVCVRCTACLLYCRADRPLRFRIPLPARSTAHLESFNSLD